jgi:trans-2,3-dihydro-3-hydroxyanthranilate isomerase
MIRYEYYVVDAFTPTRFLGNPAGVVLEGEGLTEEQLQAVAREINLSETAYILPPDTPQADVRIRWFTPAAEVKMCGHATLAAAHILRLTHQWADPGKPLRIQTASGILDVELDHVGGQDILWLHMPAPRLTRKAIDPTRLAELCGIEFRHMVPGLPIEQTQDRDLIVQVQDFQVLQSAQPRMRELGEFCRQSGVRGVCLTTRQGVSAAVTLQSRFFAPAVGVDEDPVTGSVHGPLGVYAILHNIATLTREEAVIDCLQTPASARVGLVHIRLRRHADGTFAVKVGGQCLTTMQGHVIVE